MFTRRKKIILSIAAIVLLIGVSSYIFVSSEYFLDKVIKERLIEAIDDQIDNKFKIHLGSLRGNIFSGIEIHDFSIKEEKNASHSVISTNSITLKYNLWGLLQRKLLVTTLEINTPIFDLQRKKDGKVNLAEAFNPSTSESDASFAFAVSDIKIKNGEVHYTDNEQSIDIAFPNIGINLEGTLDQWNHSGTLSIGEGSVKVNQSEFKINEIDSVEFSVTTENGILGSLKLASGESAIDFQKLNYNFETGDWSTLINIKIASSDVRKVLNEETSIEGVGEFDIDLHGSQSTLQGSISGYSDKFSIGHNLQKTEESTELHRSPIEVSSMSIDLILNFDDLHEIRLNQLSAKIADGTIAGKGNATFDNITGENLIKQLEQFAKRNITFDSNWQIEDVKLVSLLNMFMTLPADSPRIDSGIADGSIQMKGDTEGNYQLDSSVDLSDMSLFIHRNGGEVIPIEDSSLDCQITSDSVNGPNVNASGNFDKINVGIEGTLTKLDVELNNVDFGKLFRIANSIPLQGIGSVVVQVNKDGSVTGHAEIPETFFFHKEDDPILVGHLLGNFRFDNNIVYVENGRLTHSSDKDDSRILIDGNIEISENLPANFEIVLDKLFLGTDYNRLLMVEDYPIEGNLKGELKLSGFLIDRLDGTGKFVYESGNAWGINLDPATLNVEIEDYSISIPDFVMTTRGQLVKLNLLVANTGGFVLTIKNDREKPIDISELAIASEITDFPLDGKMDINIESKLQTPEDISFTTDFTFSDLTFDGNPLGSANLHGILVEEEKLFEFTGKALSDTGVITGTIENEFPNNYRFKLTNVESDVKYILPIINPALEKITGNFNGTVEVEGTLSELTSSEQTERSKKRVHPYNVDILINETQLQYDEIHFSNLDPIKITLEDDLLTFSDFSLSLKGDDSPFIQIAGYLNAETEEIDLSTETIQTIELASVFGQTGLPISGKVYYDLEYKGTLQNPTVAVNWKIPEIVYKSEIGEFVLKDVNSSLNYQDEIIVVKPFSMLVMDNAVQVGGDISINQEEFVKSAFNLDIKGNNLDLTSFAELLRNSLSEDLVKYITSKQTPLLDGKIDIALEIDGTIDTPRMDINVQTIEQEPILFSGFTNPITIKKLYTLISFSDGIVKIDDCLMNGYFGEGKFNIVGTSFSTKNRDAADYNFGVSVEQIVIDDFFNLYIKRQSPFKGMVSGTARISGKGFTSKSLSATSSVDSLTIEYNNNHIKNSSQIEFSLENDNINAEFPLQFSSPYLTSAVLVSCKGTPLDPHISLNWEGTLKTSLQKKTETPLQLEGKLDYLNELITLHTQLANNGNKLILKGAVPFNLSLSDRIYSERFIDSTMNLQLTGSELPLAYIPGINSVLTEADGVVDLDLSLGGTSLNPYLHGKAYIQSPKIKLKDFSHSFDNLSVELTASKDLLELDKFEFTVEDGRCSIEQCLLKLDGLTPTEFSIQGLSVKQYPLDSFLNNTFPKNMLEEVNGSLTATLNHLRIPFEEFFAHSRETPLPILQQTMTFDRISQKATAEFSIDDFSLGFIALDQEFQFKNRAPIPISLDSGTFIVKELKLVDIYETDSFDVANPIEFTSFGRWNMHGDMYANVKLDNLNVASFYNTFSEAFRERYNLSGILSAEINVKGKYAAPEVTASIIGRQFRLNQANIDELIGTLQYIDSDQQWVIPESNPIRIRLGANRLTCFGYIPFLLSFSSMQAHALSEPVEIKLNAELDEFGVLRDIDNIIQSANGSGTMNATITGTPESLQLKGSGDFHQISLSLSDSPIVFNNIDATFDFSHQGIEIEQIEGVLNDGAFAVDGEITSDWLKFEKINLRAKLDNCNFVELGTYQIVLASDNLHLYGDANNPVIDGDIRIVSGQYEQNWNWRDVLDSFASPTVSETDLISDAPILRNLSLDLGIEIPDSFDLLSSTGGTTNIEIICTGQLTGAIQHPIFSGTVTIPKGIISIYTQVFEIDESKTSTIINPSDKAYNPELNIYLKAPTTIRNVLHSDGSTADYNIVASVTGTLENGNADQAVLSINAEPINSSSTEELTEADILALLLPGNTFSQSLGGITFTISSGFDPNERHITAEIPLTLLGRNIPITVEGNEKKGEFGVDIQLLQGRF